MRRILSVFLFLLLTLAPLCAFAAEGDPLLSVDDLFELEDSYSAFLDELEEMVVSRGLLSQEERKIWRDAQMGDFFQNGGYGSILANYMPGVLGYVREEDTMLHLRAHLADGRQIEIETMRRYTPEDSSLSGLMLTVSLYDESGVPLDTSFSLSATSGMFLKWDAMMGAYMSVGTTAASDGETVVWSDQTPSTGAENPMITLALADGENIVPAATITLYVDGNGYRLDDGSLAIIQP